MLNVKERIQSALGAEDPRDALRTAALDIAGAGVSREALVGAISEIYDERIDAGYEGEADSLADLLDQLRIWFDDGKAWF